jgi:Protein of unknown function (DUF2656)
MTRFLLSHNYSITPDLAPPLSAEDFCSAFAAVADGLRPTVGHRVQALSHPHWRCEIITDLDTAPDIIGTALAQALAAYRKAQLKAPIGYQILGLGGLKTTPATSPAALQPGEWGVDIVETLDADAFLAALGWEQLIAGKPPTEIFQARA